jgi:acetyl esterase/lipase
VKHLLQKDGRNTSPDAQVPGVTRSEATIPTSAGPLHALVFTPDETTDPALIAYYHGGGWVIADADVYDGGARALAKQANAIVVSIDYRQAPEHKFPAAWDDALAAYRWILDEGAALGGDPSRVALAGESAGGTLAVATAVAAKAAGLAMPLHVLAIYPVAQTGSLHTESYLENAIAKPLNRAMIEWFLRHLLATDSDKKDTRLDIVNADLRDLPPVTIINATLDPLRSDGGYLEDALREAGVEVERKIYTGVAHEFFGCGSVLEKAREAQVYAGQRLRESLGS